MAAFSNGIDDSPMVPLDLHRDRSRTHIPALLLRISGPTPHHSGHPPRESFSPNPPCGAATPAKPLFSASWRMALPGPGNSLSREALEVGERAFSVIKASDGRRPSHRRRGRGCNPDPGQPYRRVRNVQMGLTPRCSEELTGRRQLIECGERPAGPYRGKTRPISRIVGGGTPWHPRPRNADPARPHRLFALFETR